MQQNRNHDRDQRIRISFTRMVSHFSLSHPLYQKLEPQCMNEESLLDGQGWKLYRVNWIPPLMTDHYRRMHLTPERLESRVSGQSIPTYIRCPEKHFTDQSGGDVLVHYSLYRAIWESYCSSA